jgi:hypothetical protein
VTIHPISTGNTGLKPCLDACNQFFSDRGGIPLHNQTYGLTSAIVPKALGSRWKTLAETRRQNDTGDHLLNDYFRARLS